MEDVGFMTAMTLVLLGNYAQTGHFGGPLAYTPFNVASHLAGRANGGLHYDYRRPKHPNSDKFMLAAGHCAPTCYALWMIMGEALHRKYQATGNRRYYVAPDLLMLDVNGGPSGIGIATAAGKAAFWDVIGAPAGSPKIIGFEGEFAMCAGHAQELKTQ